MSIEAPNVAAGIAAHTLVGFEFRRGPSQSSQRAPTPITQDAQQSSDEDSGGEHDNPHDEDEQEQEGTPRAGAPEKGKGIATSSEGAALEVHYHSTKDAKEIEMDNTA